MQNSSLFDPAMMDRAYAQAQRAAARGEVPIGAVIVDPETGAVLAGDGNQTRALHDPTAHAEIQVIRAVCATVGAQRIPGLDLYVTLEPCTLCAAAISFARLRRVVFGAADPKGGGIISGVRFFDSPTCHHRPVIAGPVDSERSGAILRDFFAQRRVRGTPSEL